MLAQSHCAGSVPLMRIWAFAPYSTSGLDTSCSSVNQLPSILLLQFKSMSAKVAYSGEEVQNASRYR
jgi:hypothetical protein